MGVRLASDRRDAEFWALIEEIIEKAVTKARDEFSRELASALKALADYVKTGFEKTHQALIEYAKTLGEQSRLLEELSRRVEEHSKILEKYTKILEEHTRILEEHSAKIKELTGAVLRMTKEVEELKTVVGSTTRRLGLDFKKAVLNVYKDMLQGLGIRDVNAVEKFSFRDIEGRYVAPGGRIEVDIYVHDNNLYLIEVKSLVEVDDVEWISRKLEIASQLLGRPATRKIIVAVNITEEALARARELGIDVIYGALV